MEPDFTIIVPTYNRLQQVAACVAALARLDYPRNLYEVIIVDDGSVLSPHGAVSPFQDRLDIKVIHQSNAGPGAARNTGACQARGRILAFTDDDCLPYPTWLQQLAVRYESAMNPVMVGGHVVNVLTNPYAVASQLIVDIGHAYHNSDPDQARFFTANNLAITARHFHELGGFDVTFGTTASEDRELCGRCLHRGYRMVYAPEAVVGHAHLLSWRTFCQQHFNYGRGAVRLQRARRRQGWALYAPDPNYYWRLLRAPFSRYPVGRAMTMVSLLIASQSIGAMGMLSEWIRRRHKSLGSPVEN